MEDASASRSTEAIASCAGCSTAASGSRATRCTSTCCTRRTSSATRAAIAMAARPPRDRRARAAAEEDRQRARGGARRARDPPDQRARRRLLPGADAAELRAARRAARAGPRDALATPSRWAAALRLPGLRARLRAGRAAASRTSTRSNEGGIVSSARPGHRGRASTRSTSSRSTSRTPPRCTRGLRGRGAYLVGPLARYALNSRPALAAGPGGRAPRPGWADAAATRSAASSSARVELVYALRGGAADHRRLRAARPPGRRRSTPRAGDRATAATEAPRGLLYHRYELDDEGTIARRARSCRRPRRTSATIEDDLRAFVERHLELPRRASCALRCEQAIRNYDPCISCATHFLELTVDRG